MFTLGQVLLMLAVVYLTCGIMFAFFLRAIGKASNIEKLEVMSIPFVAIFFPLILAMFVRIVSEGGDF